MHKLQPQCNLFFALLVQMLLLSSCASVKMVEVEVKQKPTVTIPKNIESICFMNRSVTKNHTYFTEQQLKTIFDKKVRGEILAVLDSTVSDTLMLYLSDMMFELNIADVVVPMDRNIPKEKNKKIEDYLDPDFVQSVCKTYNTDAIFVLEYFTPTIQHKKIKEFQAYYQSIDVEYNGFYRIYDGETGKAVAQSTLKKSFFYEAYESSPKLVEKKMPSIYGAVHESGLVCAEGIIKQVSPNWEKQNRFLFLMDKLTDDRAGSLFLRREWDQLIELFTKKYPNASKSLQSKIEHNIALCYEMKGNLDEAIAWSTKSYKSQYRNNTSDYLKRMIAMKAEEDLEMMAK